MPQDQSKIAIMSLLIRRKRHLVSLTHFIFFILLSTNSFAHSWKINNLTKSLSPYLKQHKKNPIWWQIWSSEVLKYAKKNNKLIFVSIGYSSCHWCHTMEQESYSQNDIAEILNKNYVAIKIDREIRPDLDLYFQNASEKLGVTAGWPLNIWLTPTGVPFHAATYLEKNNLKTTLKNIAESWLKNPKNIDDITRQLTKTKKVHSHDIKLDSKQFVEGVLKREMHIGKRLVVTAQFPRPQELAALLILSEQKDFKKNKLNFLVKNQLFQYALNGLYDPIESGFFRYTVDPNWRSPHFEKMLYTSAQISNLITQYSLMTNDSQFDELNLHILLFIKSRFQNQIGGFYSSINAVSQTPAGKTVEGHYYGFDNSQIKKIKRHSDLKNKFKIYKPISSKLYYLHLKSLTNLNELKTSSLLKHLRNLKTKPSIDKKVITSWNALAISAMAKFYQKTRSIQFLKSAQDAAQYIKKFNFKNGELYRYSLNKTSDQKALLEDYAFLISALIDLYQVDFDEQWLEWSHHLIEKSDLLFWNANKNLYTFSDFTSFLVPNMTKDTHLSSSIVVMYENYIKLFGYTHLLKYSKRAELLKKQIQQYSSHPIYYPSSITALNKYSRQLVEIAIVRKHQKPLNNQLTRFIHSSINLPLVMASRHFKKETRIPLLKNKSLLQGKDSYYICLKGKCLLPTTSVSKAISLVKKAAQEKF